VRCPGRRRHASNSTSLTARGVSRCSRSWHARHLHQTPLPRGGSDCRCAGWCQSRPPSWWRQSGSLSQNVSRKQVATPRARATYSCRARRHVPLRKIHLRRLPPRHPKPRVHNNRCRSSLERQRRSDSPRHRLPTVRRQKAWKRKRSASRPLRSFVHRSNPSRQRRLFLRRRLRHRRHRLTQQHHRRHRLLLQRAPARASRRPRLPALHPPRRRR
jgi:hypothetical protein